MALTKFQDDIVKECIKRRRGCLCVPMGTGKTLIGLSIIKRIGDVMPALVVCSKTLLGSWVSEIEKFFGDRMKYVVYHKDFMSSSELESYSPSEGTDVVLTTPEVLMKIFRENNIGERFATMDTEDRGGPFPTLVKRFHVPTHPFLKPESGVFMYSLPWKCMLIDEVQQYTNINCQKSQAISAVFSRYRWATTGTPIAEPKPERIMGYHILIGDSSFPTCIPDARNYLTTTYPGLKSTMVLRVQEQLDFKLPSCSEHIITHTLSDEESAVYVSLREVIRSLQKTASENRNNITLMRSVNAQILSMITYTRQYLVCPLIPYSSLMMNGSKRNEMSRRFEQEINRLNLQSWLNNENASKSSRINAISEALNKHPNERCIVFSCFRTNLNVMKYYFSEAGRQAFTLDADDSSKKRSETLSLFESTTNGILILTYDLGAEGLNLQKTNVVMLADLWWNDSRIAQAIARVFRRGQENNVSVYFFTSNTGMEKSLYEKHIDKRAMINGLMDGRMDGIIRKLKMADVVALILDNENSDILSNARRMAR